MHETEREDHEQPRPEVPHWLSRRPFLEPRYPHPLLPRDDED